MKKLRGEMLRIFKFLQKSKGCQSQNPSRLFYLGDWLVCTLSRFLGVIIVTSSQTISMTSACLANAITGEKLQTVKFVQKFMGLPAWARIIYHGIARNGTFPTWQQAKLQNLDHVPKWEWSNSGISSCYMYSIGNRLYYIHTPGSSEGPFWMF